MLRLQKLVHHKRSHHSKKATDCNNEQAPLTAATEIPCSNEDPGTAKNKQIKFKKIIVAENLQNLGRNLDIPVQEAHKLPQRFPHEDLLLRHTITKLSKVKHRERILKAVGKKFLIYKGTPGLVSKLYPTLCDPL